jgi:glycosyltransferase involved in cell wall biosynthesis
MRGWAQRAERLIVLSESQIARAQGVFDVDPDRYVLIPNGYDPALFLPRPIPHEDPVIVYVGRFTEVKRVPLLIEAYEQARPGFETRAPLVLVGGFPGEWGGGAPRATRSPASAPRTSTSPAGTTTTSCRTSSTPPT